MRKHETILATVNNMEDGFGPQNMCYYRQCRSQSTMKWDCYFEFELWLTKTGLEHRKCLLKAQDFLSIVYLLVMKHLVYLYYIRDNVSCFILKSIFYLNNDFSILYWSIYTLESLSIRSRSGKLFLQEKQWPYSHCHQPTDFGLITLHSDTGTFQF